MSKNLISIDDLTKEEITLILNLASKIKKEPGRYLHHLRNCFGLGLFQRVSSRTRISFFKALVELGGNYLELPWDSSFVKLCPIRGADIEVEMKSLQAQGINFLLIRQKSQEFIRMISNFSNVSVINGCTDEEHPLQALTDLFTLNDQSIDLTKLRFCFLGNGKSPVFRSLAKVFFKLNVKISLFAPNEYLPEEEFIKKYNVTIARSMSNFDVLYLDQWEYEKDQNISARYRVTEKNLGNQLKNLKIMHCLPNGNEVRVRLLNSNNSLCYKQAENRNYIQKAVLLWCLEFDK
jgi:ornithine carbamoyltransferase